MAGLLELAELAGLAGLAGLDELVPLGVVINPICSYFGSHWKVGVDKIDLTHFYLGPLKLLRAQNLGTVINPSC